ncbi:MAG TPA: exopolysaccharide biosynthesis protein [Holophagaceae bacterium]|nr:exopolysaccharide biosynthesis protein [Holophagaceae bacterium]
MTRPGAPVGFGPLLMVLAVPASLPGLGSLAAPAVGLAAMALGAQVALGRVTPWIPEQARRWLTPGPGLRPLVRKVLRGLRRARRVPMPSLPSWLVGAAVVWTGFLLLLPLAIVPLSNTLPALALGLLGGGLNPSRSALGWLGLGLSGAFTACLALIGDLILATLAALLRN